MSLALTPMNQIVPYVPPQPSDPLMEKISRLERAVNKLSRDKYDVADLENLSLYPKVRLPPKPQAELVSRVIGDHFARFGGHLSQPLAPDCVLTLSNFWANSPFVLPKNEILAESEFAAPTITKLIPILFSTSGASVAYNVNPVADQLQRAFQTILNDFLVRSFLRFGYKVSFEALDKGAIEILGPYGISYTFRRLAERISQLQSGFVVRRVRYDLWPPAWSVRPRGYKKIDRGGYIAGVISVVCHEVPMDKGNHRFWVQATLYHPSHCIPSSRIVLYRTKPDTSIE
ncbi:NADH-ubiquinone oxidoreductase chain 5 [Glycine soja]|uniref:NADH-ubiquinone oxidoreductase chain 5 n=1 Tax=Glycine soja TaxID=3848 RepID=A0A445G8K2_GLYSO|nr:NADH-ubiquinone oxidoreductase chain 5 [Glycine soja]